jgi:hypothetical protein
VIISVTGGRDYWPPDHPEELKEFEWLWNGLPGWFHYGAVGDAKGVDFWFTNWYAAKYGMKPWAFEADWNKYGKVAGHLRNQDIQDVKPRGLFVWSGGRGTLDHTKRALKRTDGCFVIGIGAGGVEIVDMARKEIYSED